MGPVLRPVLRSARFGRGLIAKAVAAPRPAPTCSSLRVKRDINRLSLVSCCTAVSRLLYPGRVKKGGNAAGSLAQCVSETTH